MEELQLLGNTAAFAEDRQGSQQSQTFQSRQTLAFFRNLKRILRQAYSVDDAPAVVPATASPMTYTAADRMSLHVAGGTVSSIAFKRGASTLAVGANQLIPLNPGDQVVITYTVAPTITAVSR
ncbi:hypothetical protein ELS24_10260 [Achromobacter spanius]|uniref:hypothetical protein n=1 Tax=Achromobacter spanius TaxID=217203 RepID=UPI000F8FA69A|nr:hypothetical protein [Achromobacter spanius]AZS78793.1 hypothetical protein ELS24_10260 [Achromobacter spanius]